MAEIGFMPLAASGAVEFGTYTGDGAASQTANLGVTPKWVIVAARGSFSEYYSGLALPGMPALPYDSNTPLVAIVSGGFAVYNSGNGEHTNASGMQYYFLYGI